jgi:hypothetical protein
MPQEPKRTTNDSDSALTHHARRWAEDGDDIKKAKTKKKANELQVVCDGGLLVT